MDPGLDGGSDNHENRGGAAESMGDVMLIGRDGRAASCEHAARLWISHRSESGIEVECWTPWPPFPSHG
jgi:hypothetical protein